MEKRRKGKSGDKPLLAAVVITLALAAAVIFGVHRSSAPESGNPKIDPVKIQELIRQGQLSGHEADHFEVIPPR